MGGHVPPAMKKYPPGAPLDVSAGRKSCPQVGRARQKCPPTMWAERAHGGLLSFSSRGPLPVPAGPAVSSLSSHTSSPPPGGGVRRTRRTPGSADGDDGGG